MITIIDYGLGNVQAFVNIYKKLHIPVCVAKCVGDLDQVSKLILPGVGHFDSAMQRFNNSGMRYRVEELVFQQNIPILGVCVGMQMMASASEEGREPGLGWIDGTVRSLESTAINNALPLPHMGWNNIRPIEKKGLFNCSDAVFLEFYFLHSYYFDCDSQENFLAEVDYGEKFCCAINSKNIFGVQFHPEKSHDFGVSLLKNFAEINLNA
jgi:imidazole glycerol-phosphate synthase subunit HisH